MVYREEKLAPGLPEEQVPDPNPSPDPNSTPHPNPNPVLQFRTTTVIRPHKCLSFALALIGPLTLTAIVHRQVVAAALPAYVSDLPFDVRF